MYSQLRAGAVESGAAEAAAPIGPPVLVAGGDAPDEQVVTSAEASLAEDTAPAVVRRPTSPSLLKSAIARAMQVAADRERERIDAGLGEAETAQVEKIYARAAAEAAELSRQADEDVSLVSAWYEDRVQRIREEADRKIDDRQMGLEQSLTHHGSLIEAEIESVHVAVQGYRASLGAFFGRLAEEQDPSAIARLAGTLPDPPDLDEARAEARSSAMQALEQESAAETPDPADVTSADGNDLTPAVLDREPVAVMDPGALEQRGVTFDDAAIREAAPVESAPSASQPSSSPVPSDVAVTASPAEALASQGNVAVRVIRALSLWASPTGDSEGP